MGIKYVDNFEFPKEAGFTGSAGSHEVKCYMRGGNVKKKTTSTHDKLMSHGKKMGYKSVGPEPMKNMDHANFNRKEKYASDQRQKESGGRGDLQPRFKEGGKWIQDAIKKPGSLRKSLGVKKGKDIPKGKLEKAAKKPGKLGERARLAETLRGFDHKAKGGLAKAEEYSRELMSDHIRAKPPKGHGVKGGLKAPNKAKGGFNSKPMHGRK